MTIRRFIVAFFCVAFFCVAFFCVAFFCATFFCAVAAAQAQVYFPPTDSDAWETVTLEELGWCSDKLDPLYAYLATNNSKAFIVLKDGRIAIEWYANGFTSTDNWYWASAGKTVTATLIGILQQNGRLSISDPTSRYLGEGWTSLTRGQEQAITIWHQLTMTSGLDDGAGDPYCTDDTCLVYKAEPGTRWAYHNAPYTLLDDVVQGASQSTLNQQYRSLLANRIGMGGGFLRQGYNNVLFSTPRAMARFGLLALNNFVWDQDSIVGDAAYVQAMVTRSQELNQSYGYLWWLNGQPTYMMPVLRSVFQGPLTPNAQSDVFYALGRNDQIISVCRSEGVVFIRMGEAASAEPGVVAVTVADDLWKLLRAVMCTPTSVRHFEHTDSDKPAIFDVYDVLGRWLGSAESRTEAREFGGRGPLLIRCRE